MSISQLLCTYIIIYLHYYVLISLAIMYLPFSYVNDYNKSNETDDESNYYPSNDR